MPVQWAQLGAGQTLVASSRGAWLQRPEPTQFSLRGDMSDSIAATAQTTRHLLDGAIAVAERAAASDLRSPAITRVRWAWQLIGQWYTAHHGIALLPDLIDRFSDDGRPDLAAFTRRKLDEEAGHDQFAIDSLEAIGYNAEALVGQVTPPPDAVAVLTYARACARGATPVEFLGFAYALERRVIRVSPEMIASVDALFEPGIDATAGLRAHAGELDIGHVEEFIAFVVGLPAADRARIALGCHRTAEIACATGAGVDPSDTELARRLDPFRRAVAARIDPQPAGDTR